MERIGGCLLLAFGMTAVGWAQVGFKVVIDPKCIEAVTVNTTTQGAIEYQHNNRVDAMVSKQKKIEQQAVSMAAMKELMALAMQNVSGFGKESRYYKEVCACAWDIMRSVPHLAKTIQRAPWTNKAHCALELGNVVMQTRDLVAAFVNVVTNASVKNPLQENRKKGDGPNLLDRYERLAMANRIYTELLALRYKMQGLVLLAQYANAQDLCFAIDPEGWANVVSMKLSVEDIVRDWRGLRK